VARGKWAATKRIIESAYQALFEEEPMTVRQCFYRLVSSGTLLNSRGHYIKLSRILTEMRQSSWRDAPNFNMN
jgi:hypothetical protein